MEFVGIVWIWIMEKGVYNEKHLYRLILFMVTRVFILSGYMKIYKDTINEVDENWLLAIKEMLEEKV